jgi:hypothetical protein
LELTRRPERKRSNMSEQSMVDVMKRFKKLTADFKIPSSDLPATLRGSASILPPHTVAQTM